MLTYFYQIPRKSNSALLFAPGRGSAEATHVCLTTAEAQPRLCTSVWARQRVSRGCARLFGGSGGSAEAAHACLAAAEALPRLRKRFCSRRRLRKRGNGGAKGGQNYFLKFFHTNAPCSLFFITLLRK